MNRLVCCLTLPLFSACPGHAQDPVELSPVEVVARYSDAIGVSDTASQGVVTRQGIEKRPLLRSGEVLESVPGLIVTQHSGDGKANQYFLRGFNLDHGTDFATSVDGMPVNMPTHAHGQGYTDLNFLIPELVARIDYSKGPYYADEGDFGSAGAARIAYADKLPAASLLTVGEHELLGARVSRRLAGFGAGYPALRRSRTEHNDGRGTPRTTSASLNGVLRYSARRTTASGFSDHRHGLRRRTGTRPTRFRGAPWTRDCSAASERSTPPTAADSIATVFRGDGAAPGRTRAAAISAYAIKSRLDLFSELHLLWTIR